MKTYLNLICLFTLIFLFSCNGRKEKNAETLNTSLIKKFDDAKEIDKSWSTENTVITHVISEPDNLHPTNGNSSPRAEILVYTQRTVLNVDFSNQAIIPGLVISLPDISSDGLKYKYTFRDNIKWDDGQPLTANDFVFTAKAFKCPLTNDPAVRSYWNNIENIILDSLNQKRFTIVMKRKNVQNISFLTSFSVLQKSFHDPENILSNFSLEQLGDTSLHLSENALLQKWAKEFNDDKYGRDPQKLNGLGMYKVMQWEPGQYITIIRKPNHWTEHSSDYHEFSYPEKIIFKLNKDEASQTMEFKSQTMDVSNNLSVGSFLQLNDDENFKKNYNSTMMPTYNFTYICFNTHPDGTKHKQLFTNVNVRRAIAMLTPTDNVVKLLYKQYSDQARRIVSNVSPMKTEFNKELKAIPFDVEAAKKLLSDAGWTDSDNNGIVDKVINGEKIQMAADFNYLSSSQEWKDMAMLIKEEMAKGGVQINPIPMDIKVFLDNARAHNFDLMFGSWGGTGLQEDFTQLWHTASWNNHGTNYSGFGNKESDQLIDSIKYEMNDSLRYKLSRRLQKIIYDQQPYVFMFSNLRRNAIHKRFGHQMLFVDRPGILENMLMLLSTNKGVTMNNEVIP